MSTDPRRAGYSVVMCTAAGCGLADPGTVGGRVVEELRAVVGASAHGVLVSAGCLLGRVACAARAAAPVVLVQPCDVERRPVAPVVRVGPLRTEADVQALGAWLRSGDLDPRLLPGHLLGIQHRVAAAGLN
jgi:hypothetical protein